MLVGWIFDNKKVATPPEVLSSDSKDIVIGYGI
jgi:hypothetical protein